MVGPHTEDTNNELDYQLSLLNLFSALEARPERPKEADDLRRMVERRRHQSPTHSS